jgi:NADH:ubiquinone oxidoreductase subunit 2 (subunit N)
MFLLFDTLSIVTIAIIGLSADRGSSLSSSQCLHYFGYSVFSSLFGYTGIILLYTCFYTFDINAMVFVAKCAETAFVMNNHAFTLGVVFILTKCFFLLGLFPFQQYIMDISIFLNYGYLYLFLVVFKLPAFVLFLTIMKLVWVNHAPFKYLIFLAGVVSFFYSAAFITGASRIKQFLGLSSLNQTGFILMLFFFKD